MRRHYVLPTLSLSAALALSAAGGAAVATEGDDPAGNNGTVKVAPHGEIDQIPDNTPHVGCDFQVEWYGYDEGDDIWSTVEFAMRTPTQDVGLTVDGPSEVFVGGDPATGAGTETGQDGVQVYTLSFDGEPQGQQGYHVKLTVTTPYSQGSDTKTKVFWVQDCEPAETPTESTSTTTATTGSTTTAGTESTETTSAATETTATTETTDVAGEEATETPSSPAETQATADVEVAGAQADAAEVPAEVAAGEEGNPILASAQSWAPLLILTAGLLLSLAGVLLRRRRA